MNENSAWLQERRRKEQEEAERGYVETPRADEKREEKREKDGGERVLRSCSICRAAGLGEESKGHIAIGHDTWLAQQSAHLQAHFKGQAAPADLEPRLVKPPRN